MENSFRRQPKAAPQYHTSLGVKSRGVDCCRDRLAGFTLTAQYVPSTATPYSYTDSGGPSQDSYTVVPSPRISFPVSLVRFVTAHSTKFLHLCEVFVFGGEWLTLRT
ncbi:hypothetical protein RRG08_064669 [Elysia crispata]|uniref:Uncharacterized protein n=1 Tax=Elysia crispata TaxID=231223 RepID=A0AAE1CM89_9GAST|nr:hypothetical protein RRG08_064669 [Elysia crispata]